jgi:hypothetical protein
MREKNRISVELRNGKIELTLWLKGQSGGCEGIGAPLSGKEALALAETLKIVSSLGADKDTRFERFHGGTV